MKRYLRIVITEVIMLLVSICLSGCDGGGDGGSAPQSFTLTLTKDGSANGTVVSSPDKINCGPTCEASFDRDTEVTLTVIPDANATFKGWSGACSGTGACTVKLNAARSVNATFTLTLHVISENIYNYFKTFNVNGLPYNWYDSSNETKGAYANPAEIGFYMLSHIIAYEMRQEWSPSLSDVVSKLGETIDLLASWQNGTQASQPNGPNSYDGKVFFQWYWVEWNPPVVGDANGTNQVVPSIDNAWLAASLVVIKEFAESNGETELAAKADNILKNMDFSLWYNSSTKRFFWGTQNNPQGGGEQDYYSNENRIVNFMARWSDIEYNRGKFSKEDFQQSLGSLIGSPGTYDGITVEKVNWDGSYFTYLSPALFIKEMDTSYGTDTIDKVTEAQMAYAKDRGYPAWGISDCADLEDRGYAERGAPPRASGDPLQNKDDGLITPHASALGLITGYTGMAETNLLALKNSYPSVYDDRYGFRDSINLDSESPDYLKTSYKTLTLDQAWTFIAIGDHLNSTLWKYFYQNESVQNVFGEMY